MVTNEYDGLRFGFSQSEWRKKNYHQDTMRMRLVVGRVRQICPW